MSSESSTHQLVGFVTKMFPTFGYINNEIFFQRKCVIGPMVEVGDHVATSAVYQPNMPIKWSAEKVWRVQGDTRTRTRDEMDEKKYWPNRSPRRKSPSDKRDNPAPRERDVRPPRDSEPAVRPDRKRKDQSVSGRGKLDERIDNKRRRFSPTTSISNRSARGTDDVPKRHGERYLLNTRELIVPDLHTRYTSLLAPVDLYRVVCHWQDSYPLLRPLQSCRSVVFQTINHPDLPAPTAVSRKDTGFYVNVLLLSMPSTTSLQDKTIIRAESLDREKPPLRKYIKILAVAKPKQRFKAIGGPWIPELDGKEPINDPKTLINSAVRICKDQIGLDLSRCARWNRFLEFRYSRTEGSTARPTSVLFPGSQLWGRSLVDAPPTKPNGPVKPYHRIVVYFIPDLWTVMPNADNWNSMKSAFEATFSKSPSFFPPSSAEIDGYKKKTTTSATEISSRSVSKSEAPSQASSNIVSGTDGVLPVESSAGSSVSETCPQSATEATQDTSVSQLMDSSQMNEEVIQSPAPSGCSPKDKESIDPENNDLNRISKKPHDEINLSSMKVSELRDQLKARNLPADGIKAQLLSRLKTAIEKEAEQARKLEEERKQKEKEAQEAAAKDAEAKKKETVEPVVVQSPSATTKIALKNYPSLVIQHRFPQDYTLQTVSLDAILDSKLESMDARSYELILCVHNMLDMIRRDSVFTLFRALVTAGDRGVQAKARPKSESSGVSKHPRTEPRDRGSGDKELPKAPVYQTVDVPLLAACTFLDTNSREYFSFEEVEEMFTYLGLPISRYQVRSLISKVADTQRVYYRALTDAEVSPLTVKSTLMYSEIDDDEYLLELIRGGDAILDEQKEAAFPVGGVLVLRGDQLETVPMTTSGSSSNVDLCASTPDVFAMHLRQLETERTKLKKQIQLKVEEVDRLKTLTAQIPGLKQKLSSATTTIDDYKRRLRGEHDRMRSVCRVLDQQIECLNSSKTALRQAAGRLRGRDDDSPAKKVVPEQKPHRTESVKQKPQPEPAGSEPAKVAVTETTETPMEIQSLVDHPSEPVTTAAEVTATPTVQEVSDAVVPLIPIEVVNGLPDSEKASEDPSPDEVTQEPDEPQDNNC